jgi:tRNA 2-thiouridine synthesizing protein A
MDWNTSDQQLDTSGLSCPLPILRTAQRLAAMASGQVLHVIATDPGSQRDFEAYARQTGHTLIESRAEEGKFHYRLRRK